MSLSKKIIIILCVAVILRIFISFWSLDFRENNDVLRYKDWARIGFLHDFAKTYEKEYLSFGIFPNNQPPGSLYILSAAYQLDLQTAKLILKFTQDAPGSNQWVNGPMLTLFMRFPSLIADILLGVLIYLFIKKRSTENNALVGSALFLFTLPVIYNSAFWGQMDSINNLLFFAAVFSLYEKRYFLSILFVFLSLFVKLSILPAIIVFFFLLVLHKERKRWQLLLYTLASIVVLFILTLPVLFGNSSWIAIFIKGNSLGEMQEITNFAFNFWWLILQPVITIESLKTLYTYSQVELINTLSADTQIIGITLRHWAILLFGMLLTPLLVVIYRIRRYLTPDKGILVLALSLLIGFLVLPTMHERYLYPVLPLLAVYVGWQRRLLLSFLLLSLFHVVNLYIVWHPMMLWIFPPAWVVNPTVQWSMSAGIVLTSAYLYKVTLSILLAKK